MNPSERSHRRAMWLIVALLVAFTIGLVGYEMNWLRQRRRARARWLYMTGNHYTGRLDAGDLPARGINPLDRLAIWLSGEPERDGVVVPNLGRESLLAAFAEAHLSADVLEKFDTLHASHLPLEALEGIEAVRHAHWLFPEAKLDVGFDQNGYYTPGEATTLRVNREPRRPIP